MCLLVLSWRSHPRYRLVVAANRDEFHSRPSQPLAPWAAPDPELLAGRDLVGHGTWLGIDAQRRFGVVTNFRDPSARPREAPSRGRLVPGFLGGALGPEPYLASIEADAALFAGFNLLLADERVLWYASNRAPGFARRLDPGTYGLANHLLDTPWPKLVRVRRGFDAWLAAGETSPEPLMELLADRRAAEASELVPTGLPPDWERALSAPFVHHGDYGTRCSTLLMVSHNGAVAMYERRFDALGEPAGTTACEFAPQEWPRNLSAPRPL